MSKKSNRKALQRTRTMRAIASQGTPERKGYPLARYRLNIPYPPAGRLTQRVGHPTRTLAQQFKRNGKDWAFLNSTERSLIATGRQSVVNKLARALANY